MTAFLSQICSYLRCTSLESTASCRSETVFFRSSHRSQVTVCWCWHWPLYTVSVPLRANTLQWSVHGDSLDVWILKSVFRYCRPALSRIRMLSAIALSSPVIKKHTHNKNWYSVSLFKVVATYVPTAIMEEFNISQACLSWWLMSSRSSRVASACTPFVWVLSRPANYYFNEAPRTWMGTK